ncbi:hypothetical protein E2C01_006131 [Portunus trituberculatus]|uniref:Uncharacterized protein n=1 Tax=Portunus trituberculatus TaxID=210409 RepID=A0A5B7CW29_PORTR|nr:hypothetical protein [Portunus trituberculatus]
MLASALLCGTYESAAFLCVGMHDGALCFSLATEDGKFVFLSRICLAKTELHNEKKEKEEEEEEEEQEEEEQEEEEEEEEEAAKEEEKEI